VKVLYATSGTLPDRAEAINGPDGRVRCVADARTDVTAPPVDAARTDRGVRASSRSIRPERGAGVPGDLNPRDVRA